jgi:hypothetical protein
MHLLLLLLMMLLMLLITLRMVLLCRKRRQWRSPPLSGHRLSLSILDAIGVRHFQESCASLVVEKASR